MSKTKDKYGYVPSPELVDHIKGFEGFRSKAYWDKTGEVWTVGYGHTGEDVTEDTVVTEEQALDLLSNDISRAASQLDSVITGDIDRKQYEALVSLTYNTGIGNVKKSKLLNKLNKGDIQGAATEFDDWVHSGGKKLEGLVRRRAAEKAMFLEGQDTAQAAEPVQNPQAEMAGLTKGAYGKTFDATRPAQTGSNKSVESIVKSPSLANFLKHNSEDTEQGPIDSGGLPMGLGGNGDQYSEDLPSDKMSSVLDSKNTIAAKFANLKDMPTKDRAQLGGKLGAAIGTNLYGVAGAMLGSSVGAMASRAAGKLQSGEHEDNTRVGKVLDTLKRLKAVNSEGVINFSDGGTVNLNPSEENQLKNISRTITGSPTRDILSIDTTNPLTNRTMQVARPLARLIAQGMQGWSKSDDPRDTNAVDNVTAMLVNSLQENVDDIDVVYKRAKEILSKFGIKESQAKAFFSSLAELPEKERKSIEGGLKKLYG